METLSHWKCKPTTIHENGEIGSGKQKHKFFRMMKITTQAAFTMSPTLTTTSATTPFLFHNGVVVGVGVVAGPNLFVINEWKALGFTNFT